MRPLFAAPSLYDQRTLFALGSPNRTRAFVALCAAAFGVLLCLRLNHFQLEPTAFSFYLMQRHKCARVMLLACAWATVECTHVLLRSRHPIPTTSLSS